MSYSLVTLMRDTGQVGIRADSNRLADTVHHNGPCSQFVRRPMRLVGLIWSDTRLLSKHVKLQTV